MAIQITSEERKVVKTLLTTFLPNCDFLVFGSRIKKTAHEYSDLDVAVEHTKPIPLNVLSELEEAFAESDLPFKVDLVDFQRLSPEFQAHIKSDYERLE